MRTHLIWIMALVLVIALVPGTATVTGETPIGIEVDGQPLELDVSPVIESGRALVPFAHLFRALGAEVTWNPENRTVTAVLDDHELFLTIDSREALVNGQRVQMEVPARIIQSRTMVPIRFASENLDARVIWNETQRLVEVTTVDPDFQPRHLDYVAVEENELAEVPGLSQWADAHRNEMGIHVHETESWFYVMAAGGERPTGGYTMEILSVTEHVPGEAYVEAELLTPAPDEMVTQAFTYPAAWVRISTEEVSSITGSVRELQRGMQEITLYFMKATDTAFLTEGEARLIEKENFTAAHLVQELLKGPESQELSRIIPEAVVLRDITIEDGIAWVDFSSELAGVQLGAEAENVLVTSIVWTLVQLPQVDAVQILVEGEIIETLAGHVTIDQPLSRE